MVDRDCEGGTSSQAIGTRNNICTWVVEIWGLGFHFMHTPKITKQKIIIKIPEN